MPPRRRRLGVRGGPSGPEGGAPQAEGSAPTMSVPAAVPPPLPPLLPPLVLFYCHECGSAVDVGSTPLPIPPSSPLRVCPCCCGFLEENPPPPPPPPEPLLYFCAECGSTVDLHSPLPAPPSPPSPLRVCPACCRGFIDETHPPPPHFSGSSSDDDEDDIDLLNTDYEAAREFISRVAGANDRPLIGNLAVAAAMTALREHPHRPGVGAAFNTILQRELDLAPPTSSAARSGGEPPATAASIAALPTVEVTEPAAACAICKDDLPLASQATKLPCAHLYHSSCIVTWLELHNSCPVCRFRIPSAAGPENQDSPPTRITIRFSTGARSRRRVRPNGAGVSGPISASPTQLAQAVTGDAAGGPANSGETVSSEWPQHPESDAVMSEVREGDGFFD